MGKTVKEYGQALAANKNLNSRAKIVFFVYQAGHIYGCEWVKAGYEHMAFDATVYFKASISKKANPVTVEEKPVFISLFFEKNLALSRVWFTTTQLRLTILKDKHLYGMVQQVCRGIQKSSPCYLKTGSSKSMTQLLRDNRLAVDSMPPEGSTRTWILLGFPSLDRGSREAGVRFESRTFRSVNLRSNHWAISHLTDKIYTINCELSISAGLHGVHSCSKHLPACDNGHIQKHSLKSHAKSGANGLLEESNDKHPETTSDGRLGEMDRAFLSQNEYSVD
ncbi:hypothetical protein CLF_106352 [Clonorchis sinensis]|uniref:Uncharacterized protein n=1 Tax=Clonorchis sinensis TaxID=79923 RepID=G7YF05_CLOSI|nr:hypothetical protein CLF_106352 [Clonorchis sinensis]